MDWQYEAAACGPAEPRLGAFWERGNGVYINWKPGVQDADTILEVMMLKRQIVLGAHNTSKICKADILDQILEFAFWIFPIDMINFIHISGLRGSLSCYSRLLRWRRLFSNGN